MVFYDHTGSNPDGPETAAPGSGGHHVGSVYTDEWLSYYVYVEDAGHYSLRVRSGTTLSDRQFHVDIDGTTAGTIDVPNNGSFTSFVPSSVLHLADLTPGDHEIKIVANNHGQNWDFFEILERPVAPTAHTPTTFEAEHFLTHSGGSIDSGAGSGGEFLADISAAGQWFANCTAQFRRRGILWDRPPVYRRKKHAGSLSSGCSSHCFLVLHCPRAAARADFP